MKRLLTLAIILLLATQVSKAQYYKTDTVQRKGFDKSRLIVGGMLGLGFGDYTNINISPMVGYRFSQWISAGINVNFQYASSKTRDWGTNNVLDKYKYTVYGGGVWGRVHPFEFLYIHVQPEYNAISEKQTVYTNPRQVFTANYGAPSLLVGGGYMQAIGGNSYFTIGLLYDVLQDANSPYGSQPIYQGGINIGL
ncbi:hypothetical protein COR50_09225 [Chitinophaga caeni]|uniref:Outer membrane protein beta-barrel domain-containing protein n=1 Tax=Chitinophaga caeni TaxID=2029983 RepID=A0A291QTS7_9BACT|nr:hypothetical protein [Chitinophaga caeni]ATL47337.1 hypothetical protein COR50_09225 [Chitinophaga caeni]